MQAVRYSPVASRLECVACLIGASLTLGMEVILNGNDPYYKLSVRLVCCTPADGETLSAPGLPKALGLGDKTPGPTQEE